MKIKNSTLPKNIFNISKFFFIKFPKLFVNILIEFILPCSMNGPQILYTVKVWYLDKFGYQIANLY
jgi:hypothetical protein